MNTKIPDLDTIITKMYGHTLKKYKNIKTAYSIFTSYKNIQTEQIIYFYLFKTSSKNHLSEGTISYALKKYNPFLSPVQFLQISKNFDQTVYLIKSSNYLISINELISLKKECQQVMEKQYILETIKFLISIYKSKKWTEFPQLTPKSLGLNDQGHLKICDYEFYFKKQFQMRSLTQNICSCLNPMIKIAFLRSSSIPNQDEYDRLKQYYGQSFAELIKVLVLDPMQNMQKQGVLNGKGKQINVKKIQETLNNYYKSSDDQINQTDKTFDQDDKRQSQSSKYRQSDLLTSDSIKKPFLIRDQVNDEQKIHKNKKIIKIISIFMIFLVITAGILLFFMYYSNQIRCDVGSFQPKGTNQCLLCPQGCLRCQSQQKEACFSCSSKMFLVLNDQKDVKGSCQSTCTGIILRSNLCLKNKPS